MNSPDSANSLVSKVLFASQLGAMSVYGAFAGLESILAGNFTVGVPLIIGVVLLDAVVLGFQLPSHFAQNLSFSALAILTLLLSLIGLGLAYGTAFREVPDDLAFRSSLAGLQRVSQVGFWAFAIAFLACMVAIIMGVSRQARREAQQ